MEKIILFSLITFVGLSLGQDESGVIWMPSPHRNVGRNGQTARWLIIHGTAGGSSAEAIGAWFQNPSSGVSTHYVVGRDGKIVQCVLEKDTAWGNGRIESGADTWWSSSISPNSQTISIENVKPSTDNSDIISEAQKTSIFYLIRNIVRRHPGIRLAWANSSGGITGHFSMSPQSRARCPGPFPWSELWAYLNNHATESACRGIVNTDSTDLNVRVLPTSTSAIQGSYPKGAQLPIHRRVIGQSVNGNTGWFHVWNGYVSAYYIDIQSPNPSWCHK